MSYSLLTGQFLSSFLVLFRMEAQSSDRGDLAHKKQSPPSDHHRSLGKGPLLGPTGGGGSYERGTPVDFTSLKVDALAFRIEVPGFRM